MADFEFGLKNTLEAFFKAEAALHAFEADTRRLVVGGFLVEIHPHIKGMREVVANYQNRFRLKIDELMSLIKDLYPGASGYSTDAHRRTKKSMNARPFDSDEFTAMVQNDMRDETTIRLEIYRILPDRSDHRDFGIGLRENGIITIDTMRLLGSNPDLVRYADIADKKYIQYAKFR